MITIIAAITGKPKKNRSMVMTYKSYLLLAILIVSISVASCFHPASPDDDLTSGVLLGDIVAVQQALDRGASASKIDKNGMTPLMYACGEYKHFHGEAGGKVSVNMKLDFNNSTKTNMNVQASDFHASRSSQTLKGNREIVELLIARGADVNVQNKNGQTALAYAIRNNLPELAEILRNSGAKE